MKEKTPEPVEPAVSLEPAELTQEYTVIHKQVGRLSSGDEFVGGDLYPGERPEVAVKQLRALRDMGAIIESRQPVASDEPVTSSNERPEITTPTIHFGPDAAIMPNVPTVIFGAAATDPKPVIKPELPPLGKVAKKTADEAELPK